MRNLFKCSIYAPKYFWTFQEIWNYPEVEYPEAYQDDTAWTDIGFLGVI